MKHSLKYFHLAVGDVRIVTRFHRQRPTVAAFAEAHVAVLAAPVGHVADGEHLLTLGVGL